MTQLATATAAAPTALDTAEILRRLKRHGVTHFVWLPDSESAVLYDLVRRDADISLVQVCREGESFAVAAGLFVAGKKPVVVIQSTGFFESGDSVRGLALWLRLPLLLLIGYRGWQPDGQAQDTAARFLEPVLDAWRIDHRIVQSSDDIDLFEAALAEAEEGSTLSAVLIAAEWA
ncbi:MAG: thiamine pyrophosphate-binding protein [Chloroflexota bacterium]